MRKAMPLLCLILAMIVLLPLSRPSAEAHQPVWDINGEDITYWPTIEQVEGRQWVVLDRTTGDFLLDHRGDEVAWPASTTKIMTALLVLESGDLDRLVTVSPTAVKLPAGSSKIGLMAGEMIRVHDLLGGMMTSSGNDAANALAEELGGDLPGFAEMMNTKAKSLGMTATSFTNPSGLHDELHFSTVRDIAILTAHALENELFRELISLPYYSMPTTNLHPYSGWAILFNTNRFVNFGEGPLKSVLIDRYLGGKTGTTFQAGSNLVTVASTHSGHELVAVLFGIPSGSAGNVYIYSRTLLEVAAAMIPQPDPSPLPTTESVAETTSTETMLPIEPTTPVNPADPDESGRISEFFWRTAFIVLAALCLVLLIFDTAIIRRLKHRCRELKKGSQPKQSDSRGQS